MPRIIVVTTTPFPNLLLLRAAATVENVDVTVKPVRIQNGLKTVTRWSVTFQAGNMSERVLQKDRRGDRLWSDLDALAANMRENGVKQLTLKL